MESLRETLMYLRTRISLRIQSSSTCSFPENVSATPRVEQETYFRNLPEEIKLKIFSYFSIPELCSTISLVCKEWYRLAHDSTLWKEIGFRGNFPSVPVVLTLLQQAPKLKALSLYGCKEENMILQFIGVSCPQLEALTLCNMQWNKETMMNLTRKHLNLQRLILIDVSFDKKNHGMSISRFKRLKKLEMSHCNRVFKCTLRQIAYGCSCLEELNLEFAENILDREMMLIIHERKGQLTCLTMNGKSLTDETYRALQHCQRLEKLIVAYAFHMTDQGLLEGLGQQTSLRFLRLEHGYKLSAEGLCNLFSRTSNMGSSLQHLDLRFCFRLNNECLKTIATKCPLLTYLGIMGCVLVSDIGVKYVLMECKMLRSLNLCNLLNVIGSCFFLIPILLPHLKHLYVAGCENISYAVLRFLLECRPNLKISDHVHYL